MSAFILTFAEAVKRKLLKPTNIDTRDSLWVTRFRRGHTGRMVATPVLVAFLDDSLEQAARGHCGVTQITCDGRTYYAARASLGLLPGEADEVNPTVLLKEPLTSYGNLAARKREICAAALAVFAATGEGVNEVWAGRVKVFPHAWVGDLCYMSDHFGWSDSDYLLAYGYVPGVKGSLTSGLRVHTFGDYHIMVVPCGGDGPSPVDGLSLDTGSLSFVSTDRSLVDRAHAAAMSAIANHRSD